MADIIDEHEAARRLSMTVEEVIYRLDYGQMMGVEVDGGWRIDTRDLESFRRGQALGRAIAAAGKAPVDSKSPEDFQEISADESPGWRRNPEYEIDLAIVPARVEARCAGATVAASGRTLTVMELGHGACLLHAEGRCGLVVLCGQHALHLLPVQGICALLDAPGRFQGRGERDLGL